ncbi:MAG TPA: glucose 1-dehydrogenase [Stellaceae bacterium]|nr:glucose 1-dehydrogenase [Stellaceae bacterium]
MDLFDLTGKTAVITGSSRGIGRAIAEQMAEAGANVVISSRKAGPCEEVAAGIIKAGGSALSIPCNVGDKAQLQALIARTREHFGQVDILVCNAAVNPYYGPLLDVTDEAYDKTMSSNVRSNLWLMQLVMPEMAERKDGVVIIISSIAGLRGSPMLGVYAISKAADLQLCRNLAVEWGRHNIRINCIAPGLIKTDFARALWEDPVVLEQSVSHAPLRRIGEPVEIAGTAVFLASKAGSFITGQAIVVDGGVTIAGRL